VKLEINRVNDISDTPDSPIPAKKDIEWGDNDSDDFVDWMAIDKFDDEKWEDVFPNVEEGEVKEFSKGRHYEVLYNDYWYYCKIDKKVDSETYDILYKQYDPSVPSLSCNNRLVDSMLNKVEFGVNVNRIRELSDFKQMKNDKTKVQVLNYRKGGSVSIGGKPIEWLEGVIDEVSDPDEPDIIYDNGDMEENVDSYRIRFYK